jgi:hypothetical protein
MTSCNWETEEKMAAASFMTSERGPPLVADDYNDDDLKQMKCENVDMIKWPQ